MRELIKKILREESKDITKDMVDISIRRRIGELPSYVRASYKWLDPKRFSGLDDFIDRVIFNTTRDFIQYVSSDKLSYEEQTDLREKLIPFVTKFVYDNLLDELKDYFDKEVNK